MYIISLILFICWAVIYAMVTVLLVYTIFLSFFGFGKVKKDYKMRPDATRFLILVAAHNEEDVIADTVEHLKSIEYDKNLYDIYVINDNSTDRTGEICDRIGVRHIDTAERLFPREGVGKPGGIQYALRTLGYETLPEKYDMLMIFDADNYVDANILREFNSQWQEKGHPEAIQAYLDSKNTSSIVSLGYAVTYWLANRFFQVAKYKLGLPNCIGGTGFVVRLDWLMEHGGYICSSLTEDLELQTRIVCDGGRILWNNFTRIYDEKPDSVIVSLRQRTRWAQGHWFIAFHHMGDMIRLFFKDGFKFKYIDQLIYLSSMNPGALLIISVLSSVVSGISGLLGGELFVDTLYRLFIGSAFAVTPMSVISLCLIVYTLGITTLYALFRDGRPGINPVKAILSAFLVSLLFLPTQAVGLLRCGRQNVWFKTPHKHTHAIHQAPGSPVESVTPDR